MSYRLRDIHCEVYLVTEATTVEDLYAFGVAYADPSPSGGINVSGNGQAPPVRVFPGFLIVKAVNPIFMPNLFFDIATSAEDLATRYELLPEP